MSVPRREFVVIANPAAGGGRAQLLAQALSAAMTAQGLAHTLQWTQGARHATALAGMATRPVVVVGGDGTLQEVLDGLPEVAGGLLPLAILPAGSGDDLAQALGCLRDPAALAAQLRHGGTRRLDFGSAEFVTEAGPCVRRFLNFVGFGLIAEVAARANADRRRRGRWRYAMAALGALRELQPFGWQARGDLELAQPAATLLAIGNGPRCGGGLRLLPNARLDDGQLELLAAHGLGRVGLGWQLLRLVAGAAPRGAGVTTASAAALELTTSAVRAVVDGELLPAKVLAASLRCAPGACAVLGLPGVG
jgi:diacylglycerol kinase (ATP)